MLPKLYWKKPQETSRVVDMLPFAGLLADGKIIGTKDGEFFMTLEVEGRDYAGLSHELQDALYKVRKQFFEETPNNITVYIHTIRHLSAVDMAHDHHQTKLINTIVRRWSKNFRNCYRNKHVIVICTKTLSTAENLVTSGTTGSSTKSDLAKIRHLKEVANQICLRLKPFFPRVLKRERGTGSLLSFWASLVNGEPLNFETDASDFEQYIAKNEILWDEDTPAVQTYLNGGKVKRLSAWLAIQAFPNKASAEVFEELFTLPISLSMHQSFRAFSKAAAKEDMDDYAQLIGAFEQDTEIEHAQIAEAKTCLQSGLFDYGIHSFSVQIFGEDEEELEKNVAIVETIISNNGIMLYRETVNCEALFWSIFPTQEKMNIRSRRLTSENIPDFCTFTSSGQGYESCTWGNEPITFFKTESKSDFAFTFHKTPRKQSLGNTIIIGGSESGKTTALTFLAACCTKYQDFKFLAFDRLNGMEVAFTLFDGLYTDFNEKCEVNPFQLSDSPANRSFLKAWLQRLTGLFDDDSLNLISRIVDENYNLAEEDRRLESLKLVFGVKGDNEFQSAIQKWLPGGAFGQFINGKKDTLDFTSPWVGFDTTLLHEIPEVSDAMIDYIFYRFKSVAAGSPHMVFIDEFDGALQREPFAKHLLKEWQQIRKQEGIIVGAIQEASRLTANEYGKNMIKSTGTFILFPDPSAESDDYIDTFGLSEKEFEWIKTPSTRKAMVKRNGGESIILDLDLSPLGDYLYCFNSASSAVKLVRRCKETGHKKWRELFILESKKRYG